MVMSGRWTFLLVLRYRTILTSGPFLCSVTLVPWPLTSCPTPGVSGSDGDDLDSVETFYPASSPRSLSNRLAGRERTDLSWPELRSLEVSRQTNCLYFLKVTVVGKKVLTVLSMIPLLSLLRDSGGIVVHLYFIGDRFFDRERKWHLTLKNLTPSIRPNTSGFYRYIF